MTKDKTDNQDKQLSAEEVERAKINQETAEIRWVELQRYFAAGRVVHVDSSLDLVDVAYQFSQDLADKIQSLREKHTLDFVTDEQAKKWLQEDALLWAVVVKPWVLVQDGK